MRRRLRKSRYATEIPEPKGSEWFVLDGICLWFPQRERTCLKNTIIPAAALTESGPGWAVVRSVLDFILACLYRGNPKHRVDWVTKVGEGLSKEVYRADVTFFNQSGERDEVFAVSQIHSDADSGVSLRMIKEMSILDLIGFQPVHFSVPKPVGMIWFNGQLLSVTSFVVGFPVTFKVSQSRPRPPWEIVGTIAAEVHRLSTRNLPESLKRHPTRWDHALSSAEKFKKIRVSEIQDALNWISENLPPKENSVLVHSDLLGQNILQTLDQEYYLIDWEYAFFGDPAYDLAIVTRGVSKPFKVSGGLDRLLDSYISSGGQNISKKEVQVYELLLFLGWYEQSLDRSQGGHAPDYYLNQLKNLLKRADL